jgi:hypothetical protein
LIFIRFLILYFWFLSAEGNKEPEGEDDDNAAAVKIQVNIFLIGSFELYAFY